MLWIEFQDLLLNLDTSMSQTDCDIVNTKLLSLM